MPSHRRPALYLPIVAGWLLEFLIGAFLGVLVTLGLLLGVLWVMALFGTAW